MGQAPARCIGGETDHNSNGIPDNKDIQRLIEQYVDKERHKQAKKRIKKIFATR